jgi:alkanesulfonate monooxygenase SsuD/methylene tetrahydromethanopterin reductase-like flavin-dependent oxidoreductase (luciferase family)
MSDAPDLGIFLPTMTSPGRPVPDVARAARHAEELGFESVWVVDQLVAGTGAPFVESTVALALAAGVTDRVKLGLGVAIVPLRPVVWLAKQAASLQLVSGGRLVLGVGVGGDRHDRSWTAAGVPATQRGARTDAALEVLPGLIAGEAVTVPSLPGSPIVQLAPGADVPPIVVGGMSGAAIRRAVAMGGGWLLLPGAPATVAEARAQLEAAAARAGRPVPPITASLLGVVTDDPALPSRPQITAELTDPDGVFGMPPEAVDALLTAGDRDAIAGLLAEYGRVGASRVVVSVASGDWFRQAELIAHTRERAG